MSLEEFKKKVEYYLLQSVSNKESTRLMTLYTKELEEFYQEKLKVSVAATLILQGW